MAERQGQLPAKFRIPLLAGSAHIAKTSRHDTHDVISIIVQAQSLAESVRVGSELASSELVTDHDLKVEAGSGIVRIECAAQLRVYTEDREVIRRDIFEGNTIGLCTAS